MAALIAPFSWRQRRSQAFGAVADDVYGPAGHHRNPKAILANATITKAKTIANTASNISCRRHARPRYFGLIAIACPSGPAPFVALSNSDARRCACPARR